MPATEQPISSPAAQSGPRFAVLLKRTATYATGPVVGRAIGLLLVPFVVAGLGAEEFGRFEVLSTAGSALAALLLVGMDLSAISLHLRPDAARSSHVFATAASIAVAGGALLVAVVVGFRSELAEWLFDDASRGAVVVLVALYAALTLIGLVARAALRASDQASHHAWATAATFLFTAIATAVVLCIGIGLTRIMVAQVIGAGAGAALGLWFARSLFRGRPNRSTARALLLLGVPQLLAMVGLWGGEVGHRILLLDASGPAEVGSLGVGSRVAVALGLVVVSIQAAWHSRVFAQLELDGGIALVQRDAERLAAVLCLSATGLVALAPVLVGLLGGGIFDDPVRVAGWMIVTVLGTGFFQIASLYSVVHRRFVDAAAASLIGTAVGLGVTAVLAPSIGATGAAVGFASSQWIATAVVLGLSRYRMLLPLRAVPVLAPALVVVPVCLLVTAGLGVPLAASMLAVAVSFSLWRLWAATRHGAVRAHSAPRS